MSDETTPHDAAGVGQRAASSRLPVVVQLLGLLLLCVGIGLADVPTAIAAGGVGLILFGIAAELTKREA